MSSNTYGIRDKSIQLLKLSSLGMLIGSSFIGHTRAAESPAVALPLIKLEAVPNQPAKIDSNKFTQPLLDTPQSVSIVSSKTINEQNAQSLQDVLKNVAGITFMSGEGNLGWGDLFSIRGFSAEQAITVDGIRDAGMSNRTESFNLEQAEVFKGTGSIESGASAVGGSVNLVNKKAHLGNSRDFSFGLGSDQYRRATADINQQIDETSVVRINLMRHYNEVSERNVVNNDRWGGAIDLATGLGTATRIHLNYLHQDDDNTPDTGLPIQRGTGGKRMPTVARDAWYGDKNLYTDQIKNDQTTFKIEHDLSKNIKLSNISRYQQTDRLTILSPARFNNLLGESYGYVGSDLSNGILHGSTPITSGLDPLAKLRLTSLTTSKRYIIAANQTNAEFKFNTGIVQHDVATGVELYRESYGDLARNTLKASLNPTIDLSTQDKGFDLGAVSTRVGDATNKATIHNIGYYFNDTLKFGPKWLLNLGLRYDRFDLKQQVTKNNALVEYKQNDGVWSTRAGLTYKPAENGSIYISYSQAQQPSAVGATTNNNIYGSTSESNYKPAKAKTTELGTKWDVLNQQLSLTAALYRTELSDSWEYGDDEYVVRQLPAKRVDGLELTASGQITDRWNITTSYSYMHGKITKGVNEGAEPKNLPKNSFSLWNTYNVSDQLNLSYGLQYVGERRYSDNIYVGGLSNNSSNAIYNGKLYPVMVKDNERAPSYWLSSVATHYKYNDQIGFGLNIDNLFNKFYYSRIAASLDGYQLYGIPGAGRTFVATVDFHF